MSGKCAWLQAWYVEQCDGYWEHMFGVQIKTLDNPGWSLTIDLEQTPLEDAALARLMTERNETDWVSYEIKDRQFLAYGGPGNLEEMIAIFEQVWAEQIADQH